MLLTTIGRRSGRERRWPLWYLRDGAEITFAASAEVWLSARQTSSTICASVSGVTHHRRAQ